MASAQKKAIIFALITLFHGLINPFLESNPVRYKGNGRTNTIREQVFTKGYAIQFDDITDYIMTLIPQEEEIDGGL